MDTRIRRSIPLDWIWRALYCLCLRGRLYRDVGYLERQISNAMAEGGSS